MYGQGAFDNGLAQARQIGAGKAQAAFAKTMFDQRVSALKEAQKKAQQAQIDKSKYDNIFGNTTNDDAAQRLDAIIQHTTNKDPEFKGAWRYAENIKNDPSLQREIKARGFTVNDFIDAMYNAASGGNVKSAAAFKQLYKQAQQDANNTHKQIEEKYATKDWKDAFDQGVAEQQAQKSSQKAPVQNNESWLNKLGHSAYNGISNFFETLSTYGERFDNQLMGTLFPNANAKANEAQTKYLQDRLKKNPNDSIAKVNLEMQKKALSPATTIPEKLTNLAGGAAGNMLPYMVGDGILGVAGKGLGTAVKGAEVLNNPLIKMGLHGAASGAAGSGVDMAAKHFVDGQNFTPQDVAKNLAINAGMGAGIGLGGAAILNGAGKLGAKSLKGEVPTYTGGPSSETLSKLTPKTQLQNGLKNFRLAEQGPISANPIPLPYKPGQPTNIQPLLDILTPVEKRVPQKKSQSYTNITSAPKGNTPGMLPPSDLDNHGYGLIDLKAGAKAATKPNLMDAPYRQGEELPNTLSHIGTKTEKSPVNIKASVDKAYIKTVDNLHRLSQFDKQVEAVLGRDLKPTERTHLLGLNSRGSDQISKQILTQNLVDKNGEVVGKSLKDITMQVPKGKLKEFEDYLVNKHAITRMERGEKVFPDEMNMTTGKSKEIVKNYEAQYPQFKDLANQYYEYNKQLGQKWLVDTGILSKDQWEGYLKANPHYVPNNRIFSELEMPKFNNSAKKGFANQSNPVKKATGSQRQIVSPIESTIEHTAQYIKTAKRNEVMQALINNIKQNPEAFKDWAEIIPTDKTPQSVMETLQKEGVNGVLDELNKGFDQKPDLTKGNIVTGIVDGQKVHVRVNDPHLLDAITNLQPKAQNFVIGAVGQVTRVMKNLTTGINPVFSLTRNIFRDIPTAYVNSKSTNNPFIFSKDLVQSVISVMRNDELYKSFKAVGGGHSSPISSDVNLLAQSKASILPQKGIKPLLHKGLGAIENLNNAVESAPRLAEFKRIAKNGDYDSKMKALYEANDVTVNFNKYGNISKDIDAIVPYFNAAIQSIDKAGRMFSNPKTAPLAVGKAFAAITIPSILDFAVNHNNPDYQKLSNYIKDNNIVIPKGDGTFYKIPVPVELGPLFHSGVTRVLRSWVDQDPKAFDKFANNIVDTFLPPRRTIAAPFSDIRSNKNYMGAPIVPGDLQSLSPRYQYDAQTSEPAKAFGNILNVSPKQIDYLAKSYGGVIGELGLPLATKNGSIGQTLLQKITADPVYSNDILSNFYDQKTKLDQAHTDLTKQGVTSSDLNEGLRKQLDAQATQIGKIRKQTKQVQNDPSLTPQERLKRLRQLQELMNQIASQNVR